MPARPEPRRPGARGARRAVVLSAIVALVGGCAVLPHPITPREQARRTDRDLKALFAGQAPVRGPISLYEAMARALKYDLDRRVKVMAAAYAAQQFDLSKFDMLPHIVATLQRSGRNNAYGASSQSLLTGVQSLVPSTSQDRYSNQAGLSLTWNILDFGVSYVQAEQNANRLLIAREQQRKVVENIVHDVRAAYWRALGAQQLLRRVDPLLQQVKQALRDSERIESNALASPMQQLTYQRTLLDALLELQTLRRALASAKVRLAALMNLPPSQAFELAAEAVPGAPLGVPQDLAGLERYALLNRPELREAGYLTRISAEQSRKALLRLLPGIEIDYGPQYDSNSFLYNNTWQQYGLRVTWNLLNVFSGKQRLAAAAAGRKLTRERRLALNMAVMTEVHIAYLDAGETRHSYRIADKLAEVDGRILAQTRALAATNRGGRLALIQSELDDVVAQLRRDVDYARADDAAAQVYASIGAYPLPRTIASLSVDDLAHALKHTMQDWPALKLPHAPAS